AIDLRFETVIRPQLHVTPPPQPLTERSLRIGRAGDRTFERRQDAVFEPRLHVLLDDIRVRVLAGGRCTVQLLRDAMARSVLCVRPARGERCRFLWRRRSRACTAEVTDHDACGVAVYYCRCEQELRA